MTRDEFTNALYSLDALWPISITSWGRTEAHNKAVGGVSDSRHIEWLAVDCNLDSHAEDSGLVATATGLGLQAIWDKDHYHIQAPR